MRVPVADPVLELSNVSCVFGGVTALDDVSFAIQEGEILGLIGPNGAGKTTCFNVVTGVYKPSAGSIRFKGKPLGGAEAARDHSPRNRAGPFRTSGCSRL